MWADGDTTSSDNGSGSGNWFQHDSEMRIADIVGPPLVSSVTEGYASQPVLVDVEAHVSRFLSSPSRVKRLQIVAKVIKVHAGEIPMMLD